MNILNLLNESTKEGMIGSEGIFRVKSKWYEHQPEVIIENDSCKIRRDFIVQTDHFITTRRPGMIFIDAKHCEAK